MIIKKGIKYYLIDKELTKKEFEEYKNNLQKHCDTLEKRRQAFAKQEKEKIILLEETTYQELQLLKNI